MGTKEICILVIDNDPACFKIVAEMLPCCTHKVLHFDQIANALNTIWKSKDRLEFVLTNVQRSDTNRFEIIQHIEKEFKLPIISISSDENKKTVPLGLESGITLYFLKSLSMNNVNNLRHFAYAREKGKLVEPEIAASAQMASATENAIDQVGTRNESSVGEAFGGYEKHKRRELKRTAEKSEDSPNDYPCEKKQRVVWTAKMHNKFLEAIQQLGHERAFPKKIVEVMDVPGLTRENVASHLQVCSSLDFRCSPIVVSTYIFEQYRIL
ncbi:two-component response regulator ARR1-like [Cornus florida]|uniref:two-component response regulator ARR1-like n=1 Tax=Cornus florida TaxID=4283 RepID=UPI00289C2B0F|nr:two-component response regulator ARR1-like [Cornus florida]